LQKKLKSIIFGLNSAGHLLHKTDPELRYFHRYTTLKPRPKLFQAKPGQLGRAARQGHRAASKSPSLIGLELKLRVEKSFNLSYIFSKIEQNERRP
jgi:hypothetical protein